MKTIKQIIITVLVIGSFASCTKECSCVTITESNFDEASAKNAGYANNYPRMKEVSRSTKYVGDCKDDGEVTDVKHINFGNVKGTAQNRVECNN
jgi:hypothetical protein